MECEKGCLWGEYERGSPSHWGGGGHPYEDFEEFLHSDRLFLSELIPFIQGVGGGACQNLTFGLSLVPRQAMPTFHLMVLSDHIILLPSLDFYFRY